MFQCICIIFRESYPPTLLKLQKSLQFILILYQQYFIYCKHSYIFQCMCIIFRKSYPSTLLKLQKSLRLILIRIRLPEDDADALKHVGVLTIYKILLKYIYIYIYVVHLLVWIINCKRCMVHTSK